MGKINLRRDRNVIWLFSFFFFFSFRLNFSFVSFLLLLTVHFFLLNTIIIIFFFLFLFISTLTLRLVHGEQHDRKNTSIYIYIIINSFLFRFHEIHRPSEYVRVSNSFLKKTIDRPPVRICLLYLDDSIVSYLSFTLTFIFRLSIWQM